MMAIKNGLPLFEKELGKRVKWTGLFVEYGVCGHEDFIFGI